MGEMGSLTDVHGKRYKAIRQWNNGYKPTFIDEETNEIPSRIECGTHWLVLRDDGVWVVEMKEEQKEEVEQHDV